MKFQLSKKEMRQITAGDEIRHSRNEVCLTQEYMAKKLGLSQSTYQRIETGEINVSAERLIQIAEILHKAIRLLFKGERKYRKPL